MVKGGRNMAKSYREIRRWLNSYKILKKTVKLKEKHLNNFITEMQGPLKLSITKSTKYNSDDKEAINILMRLDKIYEDIIMDLRQDILRTKNLMEEIIDEINSLECNIERSVCFCRYIMNYSWSEIASQLGYEERQCQRHEEKAVKIMAIKRNK